MRNDPPKEQGFILMMFILVLLLATALAFIFLRIQEKGLSAESF